MPATARLYRPAAVDLERRRSRGALSSSSRDCFPLERFGGCFWLVPPILLSLWWLSDHAWLLMAQVAGEQT
jgi:hypothetical protein